LTVIILLFVTQSSCAARKKAVIAPSVTKEKTMSSDQEEPFVVVEEMPMFPGGDSTLLAYISHNTKYPESSKTNKIQGKVIVRFCVTALGSIDRISVLRGVNPELDAEAVRVVSSLPAFKPGKQGGKAVPVWYMVPIEFLLK
jgi:protein TonB